MNESQRRAFVALGIGPLWQSRAAPASVDRARPLFALPDEEGNWLFVAQAPFAGEGADASPPEAMRLLGRMLGALGLRAARSGQSLDACLDAGRPKVIVALGEDAARRLLNAGEARVALRGRVHEWRGAGGVVPLVVCEHPSRLLEAPQEKAAAWADLCLAQRAFHDAA
ncbi:MAG: hypothetical protein M9885_05455 [Burkholderiaceae bacterium]|nr:hypothetical protein [Burkholderiaceae bacterium]